MQLEFIIKLKGVLSLDESKIFTEAELKALDKRIAGNKKDPTGIYANRVKPKLVEILEWCKKARIIRRLLK